MAGSTCRISGSYAPSGAARRHSSPPTRLEALLSEEYAPKVRGDFLGGVRSGVNGTPTFFINGQRHDGSWTYDDLVDAIEASLHATASI